jgi:hypothetical protein
LVFANRQSAHLFMPSVIDTPAGLPVRIQRLAWPTRSLSLAELYAWSLLAIGASYWGNILRTFPHDGAPIGFASVLNSILGVGAFNIAAWLMIAGKAGKVAPAAAASGRQIAVAMAIAMLCMVPTTQATVGALLALGTVFARAPAMRCGREVAVLLLGIAVELVWSSTYLFPLHDAVAALDARAVTSLLRLTGHNVFVQGNVVENASSQSGIEVLVFCASSLPLAQLGLGFLVVKVYCGQLPRLTDLPWFAGLLLASVCLTELRLSFMALSDASYHWWHAGGGVTVYTLAETGICVLFALLATRQRHLASEPRP